MFLLFFEFGSLHFATKPLENFYFRIDFNFFFSVAFLLSFPRISRQPNRYLLGFTWESKNSRLWILVCTGWDRVLYISEGHWSFSQWGSELFGLIEGTEAAKNNHRSETIKKRSRRAKIDGDHKLAQETPKRHWHWRSRCSRYCSQAEQRSEPLILEFYFIFVY